MSKEPIIHSKFLVRHSTFAFSSSFPSHGANVFVQRTRITKNPKRPQRAYGLVVAAPGLPIAKTARFVQYYFIKMMLLVKVPASVSRRVK